MNNSHSIYLIPLVITVAFIMLWIFVPKSRKKVKTLVFFLSLLSALLTIAGVFYPQYSSFSSISNSVIITGETININEGNTSINNVYALPEENEEQNAPLDPLLEAQQAFEQGNYSSCIRVYEGLIAKNTESSIPFNNLAYIYSHALGVEQNYKKALILYEKAALLGSSVSYGNILCISDLSVITPEYYFETLQKAYDCGDQRVECILEYGYLLIEQNRINENITYDKEYIETHMDDFGMCPAVGLSTYCEDFFGKSKKEQLYLIDMMLNTTKSYSVAFQKLYYAEGSSGGYGGSDAILSYFQTEYGVKTVPAFTPPDIAEFEYLP